MAHLGTASFIGKSETTYRTIVFPINTKFKADISAVYILTKRTESENGKGSHEMYYIGSSSDLRQNFEFHEMDYQIKKYELNAICVIRESDEEKRAEIYRDLVDKHIPLLNQSF